MRQLNYFLLKSENWHEERSSNSNPLKQSQLFKSKFAVDDTRFEPMTSDNDVGVLKVATIFDQFSPQTVLTKLVLPQAAQHSSVCSSTRDLINDTQLIG